MKKRTYIVHPQSVMVEKMEITAEKIDIDSYGSIAFYNLKESKGRRSPLRIYVATYPKGTIVYEKTCAKTVKPKKK